MRSARRLSSRPRAASLAFARDSRLAAERRAHHTRRPRPTSLGRSPVPGRPATDRVALTTLRDLLCQARERGDTRPALTLLAACLDELGVALPEPRARTVSLEQARDDWLRRLAQRQPKHERPLGLPHQPQRPDRLPRPQRSAPSNVFAEQTLVAYLDDYRRRAQPKPATYYRRFTLLRYFFRWLSSRAGLPDPFRDLEAPKKPREEAAWLTGEEFTRLLDAAGKPCRRRPGLAERDRLVLLALVATGLRRSELLALDWGDLDLDNPRPSLLVRRGKGGKPRRQPLAAPLARELSGLRARQTTECRQPRLLRARRRTPAAGDPRPDRPPRRRARRAREARHRAHAAPHRRHLAAPADRRRTPRRRLPRPRRPLDREPLRPRRRRRAPRRRGRDRRQRRPRGRLEHARRPC